MIVEVEAYTKTIKKATVLNSVTLSLRSGLVYGIRGENGSGKTMLLRALSGLIRADSGRVVIDGKTLKKDIEFPESMGLLVNGPSFIGSYTGLQNLEILASIKQVVGHADIEQAMRAVGLDPGDKRSYSKYSLGMKQRLGIACAVMEHPGMVLLDEPFNALDAQGIELVKAIIRSQRERGALVVVATHDKGELEGIEDISIMMKDGKVHAVTACQAAAAHVGEILA